MLPAHIVWFLYNSLGNAVIVNSFSLHDMQLTIRCYLLFLTKFNGSLCKFSYTSEKSKCKVIERR